MPPREPCDHGRYEQHGAEPPVGLVLGPGQEFLCLGGRTLTDAETLHHLGAKRKTTIVQRRTWAPGDTYLTADGEQVMEHLGFRDGQTVERWVTDWTPVDPEGS